MYTEVKEEEEPEPLPDEPEEPEPVLFEELPFERTKVPPTGVLPGEVEVVAFLANFVKASSVLPVLGALIAPTMPAWQ